MGNEIQTLVGDWIEQVGVWIRLNRGDLGEHTMGDLRDVAVQVERLGEFFRKHGQLPRDWREFRDG